MALTLDWIEGFEDQVLTELQFGPGDSVGVWDNTSNAGSISFIAGRTGGSAIHIDDSSAVASTSVTKWVTPGQQRVFSAYFRLSAHPVTTNSFIWQIFDTGGSQMARIRVNTDGTLTVGCVDGTGRSPTGNPDVCDNVWHRIDLHLDSSAGAGTWVVHSRYDGVALTDATSAGGKVATNSQRLLLGSATANNTAIVDWDDCIASADSADYTEIGAHHVLTEPPTGDGTNVAGAGIIQDQVGNTINGTSVPAYALLDELPPTTANYVRQNFAGSGNYAEVVFDPNPNSGGEIIGGVMAFVAELASTNTAETGTPTSRIVNGAGTTLVDIFSGDQSDTTMRYNSAIVPAPGGDWTASEYNLLRARVGFRSNTVGGHPQWAALWLAVAIMEPVTGTKTQTATAIVSARRTKTHTSDARIGNPVVTKTHTSTAIIRTSSAKSHTSDAEISGGAARRVNTLEGGANGTTITTGNSGAGSGDAFQNILIPAGTTVTYDSTQAGHGSVSASFKTVTTTTYLGYTTGIGTQAGIYGRAYVLLSTLPTNTQVLASVLDPSGAVAARINIKTTGQLAIQDTNVADAAITPNTVGNRVVAGSWARIEWHITNNPTTGFIEAKLFLTPTSTVADATISASGLNTLASMNRYRVGQNTSTATTDFNVDEIGWDTAGYLGPAADRSTKTHTSTAILRTTLIKTQLANAIIRKALTLTHTSDARLLLSPSLTQTATAIIKKTLTVSHASDSYIRRQPVVFQGADAFIAGGFTPPANSWVVVDVVASKATGLVPIPTVTDSVGSVFQLEATDISVNTSARISRHYAFAGPSPLPRQVFVSFGGDIQAHVLVEVQEILGIDRTDPFVRTVTGTFTTSSTSVEVDVPPYASTSNRGLIAVTHAFDEVSNPEAGWTELVDLHATGVALATAWSQAEDDSATYSWATSSPGIIAIVSEIQVLRTGTVPQSADAIISHALVKTHQTDATLSKSSTKTHTSDAIVRASSSLRVQLADAILTKQPTRTHTTTAVLSKTGTRLIHSTDTYIADQAAPPPIDLGPGHRLVLANKSISGLGSEIISDVLTTIGVVERAKLTWEDELNQPGRLEFSLPIDHPLVTRDNFAVREREIHLHRGDGDDLVWAGTLEVAQVRGWEVRFVALGWYDSFARRTIKQDYSSRQSFDPQTGWTYIDQFKIVRELLAIVQAESDMGITEYDSSALTGVTRRLTICTEERRLLSDVIDEFAAATNGFDFAVLPDKRFRMWFPRRSSGTSVTLDGTATFSDIDYTIDGQDIITQVSGIGPAESCDQPDTEMLPVTPSADAAVQRYGLLDGTVDLQHNWDDEHRLAIVSEALQQGNHPRFQTTVDVPTQLPGTIDLGDYEIGDAVTIIASRGAAGGFGDFTLTARIIKRRVEVTAPGIENVTLTVDVETIS